MSRLRVWLALLPPLFLLGLTAVSFVMLLPEPVLAQTAVPTPEPEPIPFVHVVQEGETLFFIANQYGVTVDELLALNNLTDGDVLFVGQSLVVPGGEGEAVAALYTVQPGDNFAGIAAQFNTTADALIESNRWPNPYAPLPVGQSLVVVSRTGSALPQPVTGTPHIVRRGETLLMVAARYGLPPIELATANQLPYPSPIFAGQRLRVPSDQPYRFLPGEWVDIQIRPFSLQQGDTLSIYVENLLDGQPTGSFAGQTLRFFPFEEGYAALVGLDAFTAPDTYLLTLEGSGSRPWRPFTQPLTVETANYGTQFINLGEEFEALLQPEVRQTEDDFLSTIYTNFSETRYWDGVFTTPVTTTVITAPYGDGRSYNGGPVDIFHTGVDFGGGIGTPILAPADGVIVFAANLELRGNTIIIDHGVGVMSAYFHLSELFVELNDPVVAGQPIGAGGSTGLSTGPHLHWDLRINDVPVDGLKWLEQPFP